MTQDVPTLRHWLGAEPFTLTMSAGFFGFFAHAGMLAALEDAGLTPARVTGASAGALVAGWWASGASADSIGARLFEIRRADFWDPAPGLGLLRGRRFRALLHEVMPVRRMEACRVPVAVVAWRLRDRATLVLDEGELAEAVHASCAFPGLLQPVRRAGRLLWDGGIGDRGALRTLHPGERTLHHHLSSRSPWRSRQSKALAPPAAAGLVSLVVDGLPRLSPFRLEAGREAFERARAATARALDERVEAGVVRLPG